MVKQPTRAPLGALLVAVSALLVGITGTESVDGAWSEEFSMACPGSGGASITAVLSQSNGGA